MNNNIRLKKNIHNTNLNNKVIIKTKTVICKFKIQHYDLSIIINIPTTSISKK